MTTAEVAIDHGAPTRAKYGSMSRDRRWALRWSYFFLVLVSIFFVSITMLISIPAAFALARMKFWGSATLATGVFLTYLVPDSLLFIPLFKVFAMFGEWTGIQLI